MSAGSVYAILAREVARVKIGRAIDCDARMALFQCGSPCDLELHSTTSHDDCEAAERAAHGTLAHARVRGEWFDLTDYAVDQWLAARERDRPMPLSTEHEQLRAELFDRRPVLRFVLQRLVGR